MRLTSLYFVLAATLATLQCGLSLPIFPGTGLPVAQAQTTYTSDLWGTSGELWTLTSRLPDFSYAGYRSGDLAIPTVPVITNVKDFGATGDGTTDDTAAFQAALKATTKGALYIPAGRYKLTGVLQITKPNVVLRGAGETETVLVMARSLQEIRGTVPYGWDAAIKVTGKQTGTQLTAVTLPAARGSRTLTVASTAGITPGQMIRLRMQNPADNSLGCYLYGNQGCLNAERQGWYAGNIIDWAVKVQAVCGTTVTLARPLRVDVRREWSPTLWQYRPTVQEVGIEHLTMEFPNTQYGGHDQWAGYYGIYFGQVANSWVHHVTITDADRGVELQESQYNTVTHVTLKTKWRTPTGNPTGAGTTGHYGFAVAGLSQDNLITESELQTIYDHNLSVNSFANGNVYAGILSHTGRFDHHGGAPYENLYTEIVLTDTAKDLFTSGGNRANEPNAGRYTTFWNVMAPPGSFPGSVPTTRFPQINLIGLDAWTTQKTAEQAWIERWPGALTEPPNLYQAQRQQQQGTASPPPPCIDTDQDGLTDEAEGLYATDRTQPDTDNDGHNDGAEVAIWGVHWDADPDHDGRINLLDVDSDNDGMTDGTDSQPGIAPPLPPPPPPIIMPARLWLEAEQSATLQPPMVVGTEAQAAGGQYVWVPTGAASVFDPTAPGGEVRYQFTVTEPGTYVVWGRVSAPKESANSFFATMDTSPTLVWDFPPDALGAWTWRPVGKRGGTGTRFVLPAGTHTLRIQQREAGTKLDQLVLTNDLTFVPVQLWLEAEQSATLQPPMVVGTEAQAAGGQYVWVPTGAASVFDPTAPGGEVRYQFTVTEPGTYVVWGRVSAPKENANSFFATMDTSPTLVWDFPPDALGAWTWRPVGKRGGTGTRFVLPAGTHTLRIQQREAGTKLDQLILTNDPTWTPPAPQ